MKGLLSLLLCLSLAFNLKSQDSLSGESHNLELPELYDVKSHSSFLGFFCRKQDRHYAIRIRNKPHFNFTGTQYSIEELDQNLNLIQKSDDLFTISDFGGDWFYSRQLLGMGSKGSDLFLFTRGEGSVPKSHSVYRQKINPDNLEPVEDDIEEFITIQDDGFEEHTRGDFDFYSSEDESKYAFVHFYSKGFNSFQYKVFVYDQNWNKLYERLETLPLLTALVEVKSLELTNDGHVHLLLKSYRKKREEYLDGQPNYSLKLVTCKNDSSEVNTINVQPEALLNNINMALAPNGDLVIAATTVDLMSEAPKKMFCSRIKPSKKSVVFTRYGDLPMGHIEKDLEQGVETVPAFSEPEIRFAEDGSVFCLAERRTVIRYQEKDRNGNPIYGEYEYRYKYFGIIVSHFDTIGNDDWSKFLFKKQETFSDDGLHSSFYALANGNTVHIFYAAFNDNRGFTFKWPLCLITCQEYNVKGEGKSELVFNTNEIDRKPLISDGIRMNQNQVVFPVDGREGEGFIRISLKD